MTTEHTSVPHTDEIELDPNSLAAIRDLLASEAPVTPEPVEARVANTATTTPAAAPAPIAQAPVEDAAPAPIQEEAIDPELVHAAVAASQPETGKAKRKWGLKRTPRAAKVKAPANPHGEGMIDKLKAKIMGYRPTPKHIVIAAAVLLVLFRPWLVLGLFLLSAFIITGVFLILGYDGFWRQVMRASRWYATRHPSRSAEINRKLDNFAMKFDAFLDRFPEGTVDGLYLPDFGDMAAAEARHDEVLDRRFDKLRETEA